MNIKFTFSEIYEKTLNPEYIHGSFFSNEKIEMLETFWKEKEDQIEKEIRNATGLSFKEDSLTAYLNSKVSISSPLSIKIRENEDMCDTLVHELIHVLFAHNGIHKTEGWKKMNEDFKNEPHLTKNHILIHAVHYLIAEELFPNRIVSLMNKKHPEYIRSWEIVNKLGAKYIVNKFLL